MFVILFEKIYVFPGKAKYNIVQILNCFGATSELDE